MNWHQLAAFAKACTALGLDVPQSITRGIELAAVADAHSARPSGPVLDMTDEQLRDRITQLSVREHDRDGRSTGRGMFPGVDAVKRQLAEEVRDAVIPDLERITEQLRPRFDELAAPLIVAAHDYGFTFATTSDDVIEMADEGASAAWRSVPRAWQAIAPIVSLRISMTAVFGISPTTGETRAASFPGVPRAEQTNYSVCFAAADNWSLDRGYYVEGKTAGHLDWLALARDGLRLNSPAEGTRHRHPPRTRSATHHRLPRHPAAHLSQVARRPRP